MARGAEECGVVVIEGGGAVNGEWEGTPRADVVGARVGGAARRGG